MNKEKHSLLKIFGELPVHPDVFSTLDPKIKWLSELEEGDQFCVTCGTLTPRIPFSHHRDCCGYLDVAEYPEYVPPLGLCPECGEDSLVIDSSREMELSTLDCLDCGWGIQKKMPEENLLRFVDRKFRRKDENRLDRCE